MSTDRILSTEGVSAPRCRDPETLAEELICQTRLPFTRIAELLGFDDADALSQWWERTKGDSLRTARQRRTNSPESHEWTMQDLRRALVRAADVREVRRLIGALGSLPG